MAGCAEVLRLRVDDGHDNSSRVAPQIQHLCQRRHPCDVNCSSSSSGKGTSCVRGICLSRRCYCTPGAASIF